MKAALLAMMMTVGLCHAATAQEEIHAKALKEWGDMKFGMLICWGIYSIPAGVWEGKQIEKLGEQIQRHARIPHDEYADLAWQFNPVNFDADAIVAMAKKAGMKYVVLTAKFHDGFCMFDSKYTEFDITDSSPYKKDILKLLANACRKHGLKLGVYYSTPDWHFNGPFPEINPADNKISVFSKVSKANEEYQVNQLRELLTNYGDIVQVFFDMGEPTPAQSKRFADTVRELQPDCMINGRVMNNQGDFIMMPDNHVPDVPVTELPWESPGTFYHTWGYKSWVKGAPLKKQVSKQIQKLVTICARGGNF
ncbi:MAG: alpha-L-fucosidase, partial [Planctomycetes bacterium]|nr:alpha-L-fucosidase [Planctomycetota bacterium]